MSTQFVFNLLPFDKYRRLRVDQFTSLICNFDAESVKNIEVFVSKDAAKPASKKRNRIKESLGLETYVEEEKVPAKMQKKRGRPKKAKLFEGSADSSNLSSSLSGSRSNTPASEPSQPADELVTFDYNDEMLFVGLIDSVRDEGSYRQLTINMITKESKYKSDFWKEYNIEPEQPVK